MGYQILILLILFILAVKFFEDSEPIKYKDYRNYNKYLKAFEKLRMSPYIIDEWTRVRELGKPEDLPLARRLYQKGETEMYHQYLVWLLAQPRKPKEKTEKIEFESKKLEIC